MRNFQIAILYFCWISISTINCIAFRNYWVNGSESTSGKLKNDSESIASIIDFWKRQDRNVESQKDIVLLLGETNHGKSTISSFLTGSQLKAIEYADEFEIIGGNNNRIGSRPESLIDPTSGTMYYDCPGFDHTRGVKYEISNAYSLNKLLSATNSLKFVFVVDYSTVGSIASTYEFRKLIDNAFTVLKDVGKFMDGIAMVVTKVNDAYVERNGFQILEDDSAMIKNVVKFLKVVKNY